MTTEVHPRAGSASERMRAVRGHGKKAPLEKLTPPLVTLLNRRSDLRGVYPAADMIDQHIRGGA